MDDTQLLKNQIEMLTQRLVDVEKEKNAEIARKEASYQRSENERGAVKRAYESVIEILATQLRG